MCQKSNKGSNAVLFPHPCHPSSEFQRKLKNIFMNNMDQLWNFICHRFLNERQNDGQMHRRFSTFFMYCQTFTSKMPLRLDLDKFTVVRMSEWIRVCDLILHTAAWSALLYRSS